MPSAEDQRSQFVWYVKQFVGTPIPYRWGGDDPLAGFDCSGLVIEGMKGIGAFDESDDYNSDALYLIYKENIIQRSAIKPGCLVFWHNAEGRAVHVAIMIDRDHLVHAAGGGRATGTGSLPESQDLLDSLHTPINIQPVVKPYLEAFRAFLISSKGWQDAIRSNAYVMMRTLDKVAQFRRTHYNQRYKIADPFKEAAHG